MSSAASACANGEWIVSDPVLAKCREDAEWLCDYTTRRVIDIIRLNSAATRQKVEQRLATIWERAFGFPSPSCVVLALAIFGDVRHATTYVVPLSPDRVRIGRDLNNLGAFYLFLACMVVAWKAVEDQEAPKNIIHEIWSGIVEENKDRIRLGLATFAYIDIEFAICSLRGWDLDSCRDELTAILLACTHRRGQKRRTNDDLRCDEEDVIQLHKKVCARPMFIGQCASFIFCQFQIISGIQRCPPNERQRVFPNEIDTYERLLGTLTDLECPMRMALQALWALQWLHQQRLVRLESFEFYYYVCLTLIWGNIAPRERILECMARLKQTSAILYAAWHLTRPLLLPCMKSDVDFFVRAFAREVGDQFAMME